MDRRQVETIVRYIEGSLNVMKNVGDEIPDAAQEIRELEHEYVLKLIGVLIEMLTQD